MAGVLSGYIVLCGLWIVDCAAVAVIVSVVEQVLCIVVHAYVYGEAIAMPIQK
jgi:hypothetical protein